MIFNSQFIFDEGKNVFHFWVISAILHSGGCIMEDLVSLRFEECPFSCNPSNGKVVASDGSLRPCPYCSEKRKQIVLKGNKDVENNTEISENKVGLNFEVLSEVFGLGKMYITDKLNYMSAIPEGELLFITEESLSKQKELLEGINEQLSIGVLPSESYCFGVSRTGDMSKVAFPLLATAFKAGLTVNKVYNSYTLSDVLLNEKQSEINKMLSSDVQVFFLSQGSSRATVYQMSGIMEARAQAGRPTLFFTQWSIEACSGLLGIGGAMNVATPVFLEYASWSKQQHSHYLKMLLGEDIYSTSRKKILDLINEHQGKGAKYNQVVGGMPDVDNYTPILNSVESPTGISLMDL